MAFFEVKAKNKVDVDKKPRVYFTCHPEDFDQYFNKICEDIFQTHDCAIYYTSDMSEMIGQEEMAVDLERSNLFVVPVTFKLLTTPNRAMDQDIPYAMAKRIPVLPFMMEFGIDGLYSRADRFGELQYLNPYSVDQTEIPYREKLTKYLQSVLVSDELAKRIRDAFDAYIFLSYRKKDRKYANELMHLIHSNPECRDIAIWFDEFLTPGESFRENIEKIIDDCNLFALLVTPRLLEKVIDEQGEQRENYVMSTELPLARKKQAEKGTDIFAVEMEDTDREALSAVHIKDYVNCGDPEFRARLLDAVSRMAVTATDTPEHNFLIGLAYLDGIDVEVNRERGVELITSAAEADLPVAMEKLGEMYTQGIGVEIDYRKAVCWAKRVADYNERVYGADDARTLHALNVLVQAYIANGDYEAALDLGDRVCALSMRCFGEQSPTYLTHLHNLSTTYMYLQDPQRALALCEKAYKTGRKVLDGNDPLMLQIMNNMSVALNDIGKCRKGLKISKQAYKLSCDILGPEHADTLTYQNNMAAIYMQLGRKAKAAKILEKVCQSRSRVLGETHPAVLFSMSNLATVYLRLLKGRKALAIYKKVYALNCEILGNHHPHTRYSLQGLYLSCGMTGNFRDAIRYYETFKAMPPYETSEIPFGKKKYSHTRKKHITEKLRDKMHDWVK